jgi:hypothetical protein
MDWSIHVSVLAQMQKEGGEVVSSISLLEQCMYGLVAGCFLSLAILWGDQLGKSSMREEAVRKGHAEWVVDCAGKNQFKWKECK